MQFFVSVFNFVAAQTDIPTNFDIFHLSWIAFVLVASILLVCLCKNLSENGVKKIALGLWITIVVLEVIKQIVFGFTVHDGVLVWDFAWYAFPFQFCSSPLYILPFVAFVKEGKVRDAAIVFLATFSLFAGLCVYVYPNDVFTFFTFINHQTMFHHGVQIFFGIYLAFRYRDRLNFKGLIGGTIVFSALATTALIMNVLAYNAFSALEMPDIFNMFFISPYYDCTLPVLSIVYGAVPYPLFLCIYIIGFMLCAGLVMLLMKGVILVTDKVAKLVKQKNSTNEA